MEQGILWAPTVSAEDWQAMWDCQERWTSFWTLVREKSSTDVWTNVVFPFLHLCRQLRANGKPGNRVWAHRGYQRMSNPETSPLGWKSFLFIPEDGTTPRLHCTRQPIRVLEAYISALEARSGCQIMEIEPGHRDWEFSASAIARKPEAAKMAFTAGRRTGGDLI